MTLLERHQKQKYVKTVQTHNHVKRASSTEILYVAVFYVSYSRYISHSRVSIMGSSSITSILQRMCIHSFCIQNILLGARTLALKLISGELNE